MTDPRDDEAFTWEGDDLLQAPVRPAPRAAVTDATDAAAPSGSLGLLAIGVFGGIAVLEAVGWARSAFSGALAVPPAAGGTPIEAVAFGADVLARIAAVLSPLVWTAVVALRIRQPVPRIAWFALGAIVVLPWPAVLGIG